MAIRTFAFDKMLLTKQIPASVSTAQIIFLETVYFGSAVLQYLLVTTFVGTSSCIICGLMYCGSEKKKKKKKKKNTELYSKHGKRYHISAIFRFLCHQIV